MLNRMFCQVLFDLFALFVISSALSQGISQVRACSERLFYAGVILAGYYLFYVLRNILICVSCYCCKKPMQGSYVARGFACAFDVIVKTGLLIWVCHVMGEEKTETCTS